MTGVSKSGKDQNHCNTELNRIFSQYPLLLHLFLSQFGKHADVLSEGVGGGGKPSTQFAETHGGTRLHSWGPDGVPKNDGTH